MDHMGSNDKYAPSLTESLKVIINSLAAYDIKGCRRLIKEKYRRIVVDGTTGQNAKSQVQLFNEAIGLTDICVTKLDGTSKGGFLFGLASDFEIPIRFVGVGESAEDLLDFDAKDFVNSIFE